jgi:SPW repeat
VSKPSSHAHPEAPHARDVYAPQAPPAGGRFQSAGPRGGDPVPAPPSPPPAGDWRSAVATASGLNALAGIWLIIAPFVLGYHNGDPYWNDIVFGAIVLVLGAVRAFGAYRESWISWINGLIGAWIFVSAFWLDHSGQAIWNDIILGVIVALLAVLSAGASDDAADAERAWYRR